jgi:hypothetical protein
MKVLRLGAIGLLLAAVCAPLGCTQMGAGMTSSTLPITARDTYQKMGPASGSTWSIGFFNIPMIPYNAYNAIQKAKKSAGADGLINVTAENKVYWVTIIYPLITYHKIQVTGDAIKFARGSGPAGR